MPTRSRLVNLIKIPQIIDDCLLYFAQHPDHIPFEIKRIYYIIRADARSPRGYHAHKKTRQIIFCIQGSIKIIVDNGKRKKEVILDNPVFGLLLENMIWHEMHDFKKNTILLVLASEKFQEKDYIRDYERFKKAKL